MNPNTDKYVDDDEFMGGGGARSVKFERIGDSVTGLVLGPPRKRVQTDFNTGEVKTYKDGSPRYMYVVELQTELRDPEDAQDDGMRALFLKWHSLNAVRQAITNVGAKGLRRGGVLTLTFTGTEPPPGGRGNPVKLYSASYIPPDDGFMSDQATEPPTLIGASIARAREQAAPPPPPPPPAATSAQQQSVIERLRAQAAARNPQPVQAEEPPF
jgi:hypothetical protein